MNEIVTLHTPFGTVEELTCNNRRVYNDYMLIGNRTCDCVILVYTTVKITLSFTSCNYLTVTGTIIPELHSNVYNCLY